MYLCRKFWSDNYLWVMNLYQLFTDLRHTLPFICVALSSIEGAWDDCNLDHFFFHFQIVTFTGIKHQAILFVQLIWDISYFLGTETCDLELPDQSWWVEMFKYCISFSRNRKVMASFPSGGRNYVPHHSMLWAIPQWYQYQEHFHCIIWKGSRVYSGKQSLSFYKAYW